MTQKIENSTEDVSTVSKCLTELVEYWYEYDTERVKNYVKGERGWPPEMVDEFLIGWASPDLNEYQYLKNQGYTKDEIISTGAFTENGKSLWNGRYVFPYFNEDREVVYAIARATGKGGGAAGYDGHPEDFLSGKYAKLAHRKEYVNVDEPIWGKHTLSESTGTVIITEGIGDAMAVEYADGTVLSPVTTSFKDKHYEPLISLCEDNEIDTVYIIPDAEEVQDTAKYGVSAGVQGALTSAYKIYNRTEEIEVRVAELPRGDERKVDVDNFLANNSVEDLGRILQNAREATEFDSYEEIALDNTAEDYEDDFDGIESESYSAIYDLDMDDVLPANFKHRGKNPLGHIGDSTTYFIANSESAYDHKRKVGYNALSYILCKFGLRDAESPNGSLSDKEIYEVWYNAKDSGIISEDDALPSRAMQHVAQELGYEHPEDNRILPREIYNEVIDEVDERIGSGREKLEQQTSSKEFYADKSAYYQMDVKVVNKFCNVEDEFEDFKIDEYMWTADGVQGLVPSLALVAVEEEYISKDNISSRWASGLTDEQFADLCFDALDNYMFGGEPPYRALLGVAKKNDYEITSEGKLTKQSKQKAKIEFYP